MHELQVPDDDFAAWVQPHTIAMGHLAARLAGPTDRDDVVQDALTRAWRKRHTFDPSRGTPRAWLLAVVADQAGKTRRRRRSHPTSNGSEPVVAPHDGTRVDLERAIAKLPPRMRLAIDCVYFVGLSVAETAVAMGVTEGTVKSTLAKARAQLQTRLEVSHD